MVLLVSVLGGLAWPAVAGAETVVVRHVVDGDTVVLADDRQVRLIGINTPELARACPGDSAARNCRPVAEEPLAVAARERLRALVQGQPVQMLLEDETRDRYGRWLAHLQLADRRSVEEILLREGLAFSIAIPPNLAQLAAHIDAEAEARAAGRGVWGHSYYAARDPATLTAADTGFRRVRGRVSHVGSSRRFIYLDLAPGFALRIGHQDWDRHFAGRAQDWRGAELEARGWVTEHNGRLHLAIGHPAMIRRLP